MRLPRKLKKKIKKEINYSGKITYWSLDGRTVEEIRDGSEFENKILWSK
jgi:hypothetical protein